MRYVIPLMSVEVCANAEFASLSNLFKYAELL